MLRYKISKKRSSKIKVFPLVTFIFVLPWLWIASLSYAQPSPAQTNVFKPLDGKWKGKFYVYEDISGQQNKNPQPKDIDAETLKKMELKEVLVIDVEQTYTSKNPYYQEVLIKDTYTDKDGTKKVVVSKGVNKVENGQMLCVVNKPDEQVIHTGETKGKHTIIWQRNIKSPLKIEYFKETVEKDTYMIVGWGYYGNDNPNLSPKTWFYGLYTRITSH